MVWNQGHTLKDRFDEARFCVTEMHWSRKRVGKTYQGFIKQLLALGDRLLEPVMQHCRNHLLQMAGQYLTRQGFLAFAVDGSRINAPRTKSNEKKIGCTKSGKAGPQFWLTTVWHMGTGVPWAWVIGKAIEAERMHLRQMLDLLPENSLIVADAGFTGYKLMTEMLDRNLSFLIRVGANVRLLKKLGYAEVEKDGTVYLWPEPMMRNRQPPLILRLVKLKRGKKAMCLLTNLDEPELSQHQAKVLYEMRWGVEIFFRSLKQTLQRRKMLSHAGTQAKAELAWTMIGLQLLGLMSVEQIIGAGHDPLGWSVAISLRAVRCAMANRKSTGQGVGNMLIVLSRSLKDGYERKSKKQSRNWPYQKTRKPPKTPEIRNANPLELRYSKAVKQETRAA